MKLMRRLLLHYFRLLAKLQLKKYAPDVVGITGSAGKTSTLEAVYAVLQEKYATKVSRKANSEWGIPADILGLPRMQQPDVRAEWFFNALRAPFKLLTHWQPHEKYVVEMGIDSPKPPKNMGYLLSIVRPRTGIFLNAQPMHSEPFDYLVKETDPELRREKIREVIAAEKGKLIGSLPENGLAILNADDSYVAAWADKTVAPVMWFGGNTDPKIDVKFDAVKQTMDGTRIRFSAGEFTCVAHFPQYLLPVHFGYSLAAAVCVGLDEGMLLDEVIALLERNFQLPRGRSSLIPGIRGSVIVDSSYNASAEPTLDMLAMVAGLEGERTMALLGDMRELGNEAQLEHERVAHKAAKVCDRVYLVGPQMKQFVLPILKKASGVEVVYFETGLMAAEQLKSDLTVGDVLLVKGSQNTLFLEAAVELLMRQPERADELLCRRGAFWDAKRAEVGLG